LLRTDNASFRFDRQGIVPFLSVPTDNASLGSGGGGTLALDDRSASRCSARE